MDLSGADASLFSLSEVGVLTFVASPDYEMPGDANKDNTYEVTVGAKDADGIRGTRDVEVKVTNVEEDGSVTLSRVQPRVGIPVTASVTDIDGAVSGVKWQWYNGSIDESDLPQNAIEDATSDTYTPVAGDVERILRARANYTDPQGPDSASGEAANAVAVDIRNKAPMFAADQAEAARTVAENATAATSVGGGPVTAMDPNAPGDILTYTLGGPDASSFEIDATGQITVGAGTKLDYETKTSYMVTVIAEDSFGATASIDVTITVTAVNEGPEITGSAQEEYPENGTDPVAVFTATDPELAGAVTWSLATGDDAEKFEIDKANGVLTFAEVARLRGWLPTATRTTSTLVTVVATDADGMTTDEMVTVTVTNVDEAGKVTLSALAPYPGVMLTATPSDLDSEEITLAEWQWSRSRSKTSSNYADIENAEEATYSPTSGDVGFYLRATVTYNDGEGEGKSAMGTSAHTVQAINQPNNPPVFPDQDPDGPGDQSEISDEDGGGEHGRG